MFCWAWEWGEWGEPLRSVYVMWVRPFPPQNPPSEPTSRPCSWGSLRDVGRSPMQISPIRGEVSLSLLKVSERMDKAHHAAEWKSLHCLSLLPSSSSSSFPLLLLLIVCYTSLMFSFLLFLRSRHLSVVLLSLPINCCLVLLRFSFDSIFLFVFSLQKQSRLH